MRNLFQEQLLKAGVVDKNKADAVKRAQAKAKKQSAPAQAAPTDANAAVEATPVDGKQLLQEKAERDRALALARNEQLKLNERHAQIRQIIAHYQQARDGDDSYRFSDLGVVKTIVVNARLRNQLAKGQLIIVRSDTGYALVPRLAAEKIRERDASFIVLDHGPSTPALAAVTDEEDPYRDFPVPDDLMW